MVALGFMTKSEVSTHGYQVNATKFSNFLIWQDLNAETEPVKVNSMAKPQIYG